MLAIQVNVCYILKHLEDRKTLSVHIYYTCCDIILIFKLHRRTRLTPIHSLKIRMTSQPCNKYEQIMLSYLLSVKYSKNRQNSESCNELVSFEIDVSRSNQILGLIVFY